MCLDLLQIYSLMNVPLFYFGQQQIFTTMKKNVAVADFLVFLKEEKW